MKKGYLIYLIGISGSGKTTIANELDKQFRKRGIERLQLMDGDTVREDLGNMFGYTYEERMKNNKVVRVILKYLLNNGVNVILSQVAAYESMRQEMRKTFGDRYIEIYVKCSVEECARRDVKGYYKRKTENLNAFSDGFEPPTSSEITVDTEKKSVWEVVAEIMNYLEENNYEL